MIDEDNNSNKQVVLFNIDTETFGVKIKEVREIITVEDITKLPNIRDYIKGVVDVRGEIVVVLDLPMKLGLPVKEIDRNSRILVLEIDDYIVGMLVDASKEVLTLNDENFKKTPKIITDKIDSKLIEAVAEVDKKLIVLLDLAKVICDDTMTQIKEVHKTHKKAPKAKKEE